MPRLLADIGGPFYDSQRPFRNWSALPFYQLDTPAPPYVDAALLDRGVARAETYLEHIRAQGYTGFVIDNLAHLVTFDRAPERVYAPDSPCRLRALAYGAAFGRLFDRAAALGMEAFVATDMQWSTPEVRRYAGPIRAGGARVAALNRWALEELFGRFPQLSGVFVRVGEAGGAHDQGDEYRGHMVYRSARDLRWLVGELLPVCERAGRLLVVRTWSIGIGELGDMMWSPERYRAALGGFSSPLLRASIKHGPSDFFRHLPHNPTIGLPGPAQVVELQNRREYELFGMVPSSVARVHGEALRHARGADVWAWNASGGWGGGTAALGELGWSLWTELSSALTAALARDPDLDAAEFARAWCAGRLGGPIGDAAAELYIDSGDLIERAWYLGPLSGRTALGKVVAPPLLWVWWMRPTAAPLLWAYLASAVPDVPRCLADGAQALERLDAHVARLAALRPAGEGAFVLESARYMRACLGVAQAIRAVLLPAAAAALAGDRAGWDRHASVAPAALRALAEHRGAWGGRRDFTALELDEIERYLRALAERPELLWVQARAAALVARRARAERRTGPLLAPAAAAALSLAVLGAWRSGKAPALAAGALAAWIVARQLRQPALRVALPWLCRRAFLLPSIFFETGPSFSEWTT